MVDQEKYADLFDCLAETLSIQSDVREPIADFWTFDEGNLSKSVTRDLDK